MNVEKGVSLPFPDSLEYHIWFLDSVVVYETKMYHNFIEYNGVESSTRGYWKHYKFSFVDLKTMRCQDYRTFSDTAKPFCSYILGDNEGFGWRFYASKSKKDTPGIVYPLADTTIQSKVYKRIKVLNTDSINGYEYVYYFDCNIDKSIFHLNRSLDDYFTDCHTVRYDLRGNLSLPLTQITEWQFESDKLLTEEIKVLKTWSENLRKADITFINFKEAVIQCKPD